MVLYVCVLFLQCAFGVTTIQEASISVDNCTIVTPGYYARAITNGIVTQTTACPQKYYCGGGVPKAAFSPVTRTIQSGDPTIALCPYGMWTIDIAATAAQQCCEFPACCLLMLGCLFVRSRACARLPPAAVGSQLCCYMPEPFASSHPLLSCMQ